MDFGKRETVDGVDFQLPPMQPVQGTRREAGGLRVWIGAPGWNAGLDSLWPPKLPPAHRLAHYAESFATVELNATFHAIPSPALVGRWAAAVPPGFRFGVKAPRSVSHDGGDWRAAAKEYSEAASAFGERWGIGFFQAPPEASPAHEAELLARVDALGDRVGALEVRHPAWFENGQLRNSLAKAMAERGLAACISDTPGRRDAVHTTLPAPRLVLRFLGVPGHPSTRTRLEAWASRAAALEAAGLEELWLYVHQPENRGLLELAAEAQRAFEPWKVAPPGRGEVQPRGEAPPKAPAAEAEAQLRLFGP